MILASKTLCAATQNIRELLVQPRRLGDGPAIRPEHPWDERLAQCQTVLGRAAVTDPTVDAQVDLRLAQLADGDERPMSLVERADLILQRGQKPCQNAVP